MGILAAVVAAMAVVVAADCSVGSCSACRLGTGNTNQLGSLPRMSIGGATVSADLSTYNLLDCSNASASQPCQFIDFETQASMEGVRTVGNTTSTLTPMDDYTSGIGLYAAGGLLLAVLSVLWGGCLFVNRFLCCCIYKHGGCGAREPTMRSGNRGLGFHNHKWFDDQKNLHESWIYAPMFVNCCRLTMVVYTITIFVAFGMGVQAAGNFERSVEDFFLITPASTVSAMDRSAAAFSFLLKDLGQDTTRNFYLRIQNRFTASTDITALKTNADAQSQELEWGLADVENTKSALRNHQDLADRTTRFFGTNMPEHVLFKNQTLSDIDPFIQDLRDTYLDAWQAQRAGVLSSIEDRQQRVNESEQVFLLLANAETNPAVVAERLNSTAETLPETQFVFNVVFGPVEQCPNMTLLESVDHQPCDNTSTPSTEADISLTNLIAGDMSGSSTDAVDRRQQLEDGLISIQDLFDSTIDIQVTTDKLAVFKANIDRAYREETFFPSFVDDLNSTLVNITAMPNFDGVNASVWALHPLLLAEQEQVVTRQQVTFWQDRIIVLDRNLDLIPTEQVLIANESFIVDFWAQTLQQARALNISAIRVDPCFSVMTDFAERFPAAMESYRLETDEFQANMTHLMDTFNEQDSYRALYGARLITDLIENTQDQIAFADLEDRTYTHEILRERLVLADTITDAERIGAAIVDPDVPFTQEEVDQYQDLYDITTNTRSVLSEGITALHDFSLKRCDIFGKIGFVCNVDLDCLGGTCLPGLERCSGAFLVSCTDNSECPPGDFCLFHRPTFENLRDTLADYALVGKPESAAHVEAMRALNATLAKYTPDSSDRIARYREGLQAASVQPEIDALDFVEASIEVKPPDDAMPITALLASAQTLYEAVSVINDTRAQQAADDYAFVREQIINATSSLNQCKFWANNLDDYMTTFVPEMIPQLEASAMDRVIDENGINGGFDVIASVTDEFFNWATVNCDVDIPVNFSRDMNWLRQRMEAVTSPVFVGTGALSQWTRMVLNDADDRFVPVDDLEAVDIRGGGVELDRFGERWPPNPAGETDTHRLCFTEPCVENSLKHWKQSTQWAGMGLDLAMLAEVLTAAQAQFTGQSSHGVFAAVQDNMQVWFSEPDSGLPSLQASRAQLMTVALSFPVLVVISGLVGALAFCKSCRKWQRWPEACAATFMFFLMAGSFLFAGGVWFPSTLVLHDACASAEDVGQQWVRGSMDYLCLNWLRGRHVEGDVCVLDVYGHVLRIDLVTAYSEFMGECPVGDGRTPASELDRVYAQMGAIAPAITVEQFNTYFGRLGSTCTPDAGVAADLDTAAHSAAFYVEELFLDVAKGLGADAHVPCGPLNAAMVASKDAFCCDVVSSLLSLTLAWFIVGFATCCCGIPAAVMGYKRFPNQLWGPGFNKNGTDFTPLGDAGAALSPLSADGEDPEAGSKATPKAKGGPRGRRAAPPTPAKHTGRNTPGSRRSARSRVMPVG